MDRRTFLACGAAALLPSGAGAQQTAPGGAGNWPRDRPIRLIITYPPGGTSDFVARLFAQHLGEQLGQSVVVENRAGGGGVLGWTAAARAAPDGYTLLQTDNSLATAPPLHPDLSFDVMRDFTPISMMVDYASVFVVPAELPVRTWQEFVALVRQRGQAESFYGSMGPGSSPHLYVEVLQELADLRMTHVSYRGMGPAMTDLLANRVQLLAAAPPTALGHIAAGRVRAIAVGTPGGRIPALPDVPTLRELGVDFTYSYWYGLLAPRGLDPAIAARLDEEIRRTLAKPEVRARFIEQGAIPVGGDGEALRRVMARELERWTDVIRSRRITRE